MARILYLHGLESSPNAGKATRLREEGHEVVGPQLDHAPDLTASIATAQAALDAALAAGGVDVVVASSRGGAVATGLQTRGVPLLLLCPAWKRFGLDARISGTVRILHAAADDLVPLADSVELLERSGLPAEALTVVGDHHKLHDPAATAAMLAAVLELAGA
ncbi:MAG: alpha/beta hydrolase [Deltaproteobacteria bacterium]|nr:alpha/beta hydrolase [Deltaproteobacteria bacterium]